MSDAADFTFTLPVRFSDLDALAHVNNAVYLTYLESARIAWWWQLTERSGLPALDMILARAEIDFRAPLFMGDDVSIAVRCTAVGRSSFTIGFRITEAKSGRLVADARKVCVYYDFPAQKSLPLPGAIRARLAAEAARTGSAVA